jgi:hypothetical protein
VQTLFLAVWLGCILACLLKMGSPHRNPSSWLVAALVGGFGSVLGLFVARAIGISRDRTSTLAVAVAVSAGVTLLYAAASRLIYAAQAKRGRETRPTIVF